MLILILANNYMGNAKVSYVSFTQRFVLRTLLCFQAAPLCMVITIINKKLFIGNQDEPNLYAF